MEPLAPLSRLDVLKAANPWWFAQPFPQLPPQSRPLIRTLIELMAKGQCVWLFGPRGVGKTTMVYHALAHFLGKGMPPSHGCYLPGDHPALTDQEPELLLSLWREATSNQIYPNLPRYIIIDEPCDQLPAITQLAMSPPPGTVVVVITSASPPEMDAHEETGARVRPLYMPPISFPEFAALAPEPFSANHEQGELVVNQNTIVSLNKHFDAYMQYGGFYAASSPFGSSPLLAIMPTASMFNLHGVANGSELRDLLLVLAREDGNHVSMENLSKATGLSKNTIRKYLKFFEATHLVRIVHRINKWGARMRRARTFRIFLAHPCLRYLLLGVSNHTERDHTSTGALMAQLPPSSRIVEHAWNEECIGLAHVNPDRSLKPGEKVAWAMEVTHRDQYLDPSDLVTFCRVHHLDRALMTTHSHFHATQLNGVAVHQLPLAIQSYVMGYRLMWRRGLKITWGA